MSILEVTDLRKCYGSLCAVDGVTFSIEPGEIFGLLGPNGAGKSTTINIIATLIEPDSGEVRINGVASNRSAAYKQRLGYVPQEISLAEKLTARENLRLVGNLYNLRGSELTDVVEHTLGAVGLADRAKDYVSTFSGGMKRRMNIAAALLHTPDLLLMDEPTAGVDPQARAYIFDIVEKLASEGRAILYTTHYMEEAQRLCQRTAIIDHGKILACGTLSELIAGIHSTRELTLEAERVEETSAAGLAKRLGDAAWSLEGNTLRLNLVDKAINLPDAIRIADDLGLKPRAVGLREPTLETVFLELTGRALRE